MARTLAETTDEVSEDDGLVGQPWKTILFNCDCHTFDQVEKVVIAATRCSLARARRISNEVHTRGSAVVCEGTHERCETVAATIGSIGLSVKVAQ
ncbi:MAG: ATP-dependent Clp protease adaptor ClpS [Elusimicrobiota bacterium]